MFVAARKTLCLAACCRRGLNKRFLRLDFSVLNFLSILSDLPLTRETDKKKAEHFLKTSILE
jgi:hypothetical protein